MRVRDMLSIYWMIVILSIRFMLKVNGREPMEAVYIIKKDLFKDAKRTLQDEIDIDGKMPYVEEKIRRRERNTGLFGDSFRNYHRKTLWMVHYMLVILSKDGTPDKLVEYTNKMDMYSYHTMDR